MANDRECLLKTLFALLISSLVLITTFMRFVLLMIDGKISWETETLFCITTKKKALR